MLQTVSSTGITFPFLSRIARDGLFSRVHWRGFTKKHWVGGGCLSDCNYGNARERAGYHMVTSFNGGSVAFKVAVYQIFRQAILTFYASFITAHMLLLGRILRGLYDMCTITLMLNAPCVYRYM